MSTGKRFQPVQGELFSPPAKLPQMSPEVWQRIVQLLARMINDHLDIHCCAGNAEAGDE